MHIDNSFVSFFKIEKPIIGMVHLLPLPGSPLYDSIGGMNKIYEKALEDSKRLIDGGIDALQVENQWDRPFCKPEHIGPETVASITNIITRLREHISIPMGVNIHLNGVVQAIAVAVATGCGWVRCFELANAYISNAGVIEAAGPSALRYRYNLRAENNVMIFGDFHVKHGSHAITADRPISEQMEDIETVLGDAAIVTGLKTGEPPNEGDLREAKGTIHIPILIGSGLSAGNVRTLLPYADGAIVGSYFKVNGELENEVDVNRVQRFMNEVEFVRSGRST